MELYTKQSRTPLMKSIFVYEQMKKELLANKWDFSQKIIINDLIERFNVSRRPVMDAMKMLENDGFIEIVPQSGCKIIDYSPRDVIDQLLLSRALESLCAELAVENHTKQQLESLENLQANTERNFSSIQNNLDYFAYNRKFHFIIASMTQSPKIGDHAIQMWDLLDFYLIRIFRENEIDVVGAWNFHNQIMEAIQNNDKGRAKETMENHMNHYIQKIHPFHN